MLREVRTFSLSTSRSTTRAGPVSAVEMFVKWKNMKLHLTNNGTKAAILLSEMIPESGLQWHREYTLFE